jgi:hypothetical protein
MARIVQHGGPKDWTPPSREVKVLFRVWKEDGELVALFPELPGDEAAWSCTFYVFQGGHGSANCRTVIDHTRPARPEEYAELLRHLGTLGYTRLKVVKRLTRDMILRRRQN